ncbi:MAG TPA: L-aspartate oxidase [Terriglobales bacterium]|nr:L-aspartate oxidase [Terriglobales bacterium]
MPSREPSENFDFIIIGAGIAGLRAALELPHEARTLMLAKDARAESATEYAQGGIAVVTSADDSEALHAADTIAAGDGLCHAPAVEVLVRSGGRALEELLAWGAEFDRGPAGELARTQEAAHSRRRILHAHGDSTGREIAATLSRQAEKLGGLEWRPHCEALALVVDDGAAGGLLYRDGAGAVRHARARAVLVATGGLGQLYRDTTNPSVATGDGPGLAYRAGAELRDMEFVQFHPTALALAGAPRFLLSEALRGEGAVLRNAKGERFMLAAHPAAELAPRDVVARAVESEIRRTGAACYLDATGLGREQLERHFPRITRVLGEYGLRLADDVVPVRPAAHYAMGGIATGLDGATTMAGLYAAGECACTGVHGANRLASNSLLEGLVFGARAGRAMAGAARSQPSSGAGVNAALAEASETPMDELRTAMSEGAGVVRNGAGLAAAASQLERLAAPGSSLALTTAQAVVRAAAARHESRGAHFREDFPAPSCAWTRRHSRQRLGAGVDFVEMKGSPVSGGPPGVSESSG